jgi:hypothetical protein
MPGRQDGNLRGGHLSQGFGLEFLRPFAFVAPVPPSEDVGADAIATLFRRVGRNLLAEDSFVVQVKSVPTASRASSSNFVGGSGT